MAPTIFQRLLPAAGGGHAWSSPEPHSRLPQLPPAPTSTAAGVTCISLLASLYLLSPLRLQRSRDGNPKEGKTQSVHKCRCDWEKEKARTARSSLDRSGWGAGKTLDAEIASHPLQRCSEDCRKQHLWRSRLGQDICGPVASVSSSVPCP